jgi:hypothetical protein
MECSRCNIRSSVGYCTGCHELLCEECGISCDGCGKMVCEEHVYETRNGRSLCPACQKERYARRVEHRAKHSHHDEESAVGDTSLAALSAEAAPPVTIGEAVEISDEAMVGSAPAKWQPWQLSMLAAIGGLVISVVVILIPSWRGIPLRNGGYIPMPYVVVFLPLICFFWAIMGLTYAKYWEDREKCLVSAGLGVLCIILLFTGILTDPARKVAKEAEIAERTRDEFTMEELEDWRLGIVSRYE